jgi:hypothetical protein
MPTRESAATASVRGFVETPMAEILLETDRYYSDVTNDTPMNRPAQPWRSPRRRCSSPPTTPVT